MKKYTLIIAFFLGINSTFSQSLLSYINQANEFLETLDNGKYDDAQNFFADSIKGQITSLTLKNFWLNTKSQLGDFKTVDGAQNSAMGDYQAVILNCAFTNGLQSFRFVFNKSVKLVGLNVMPTKTELSYLEPKYADTTLYIEKLIELKSGSHSLAGMLTIPKNIKNFPIVVLIHGSGPNDMDETLGPNKPFRDIALGLAAKGIATLRYVKRTLVYGNEFKKAFTTKEEVIDDALTAIIYAQKTPNVNLQQVYVLGHSLGGMLSPKLATLNKGINGIILAAAPARSFTDLMVEQNNYMFNTLKDTSLTGKNNLKANLLALQKTRIKSLGNLKPDSLILGIPASYWVDLNNYDPITTAKKLKNRLFIFQGETDFQVSVTDFNLWKNALGNNKNVSFKLYPELNHLLTPQSEKGTMQQYMRPGTVANYLIDDIADWIKNK
ncbi:MAG: DUF3887 domain-containing protein [Sphingobacteriales bacterium]|nr:MAG: DUF3887 domain-containing protein [Sphingobacteriales bacterium]